ncbi:UPF0390 protein zgc136864-like [Pocillopora verrucosa]|uniref:UPF0390 protein zgc136864-like n=1 Tax=Pocillopora verrucosa TaxID=203993 RepID=UPI0033428E35
MAQGKGKIKKATATKKHQKKALGPKKGARTIAPKKKTTVKAEKVKKALEVTIKANIEQELTQVAVSKQSKPLKMVKPAAGKKPAKKKAGGKKQK